MRIPLEVAASTRVRFYCNLACEITRPSVSASGSASVSQLVHGSVLPLRFRRFAPIPPRAPGCLRSRWLWPRGRGGSRRRFPIGRIELRLLHPSVRGSTPTAHCGRLQPLQVEYLSHTVAQTAGSGFIVVLHEAC